MCGDVTIYQAFLLRSPKYRTYLIRNYFFLYFVYLHILQVNAYFVKGITLPVDEYITLIGDLVELKDVSTV